MQKKIFEKCQKMSTIITDKTILDLEDLGVLYVDEEDSDEQYRMRTIKSFVNI